MKKRILSLVLALVMCLSLAPAFTMEADAATANELLSQIPKDSLAYEVLTNCQYELDLGQWYTSVNDAAGKYGAGHLQGFCCDDEGKYFYASFTNLLVKTDMKTGEIVGVVKGLAAGSISSGAHIGDICYYKGKIYGSLEYKAAKRWYICVFDGDKIEGLMNYTDPGVMYGLYVPQVGDDFINELTAGEHNNSESSMGHRYGTGGIDGITFGTLPGKGYDTDGDGDVDVPTGDERFMIVTYGPYGNAKRYDNENFVFLVYDFDNITEDNLIPFTEDLLTMDYTEEQKFFYEHKLFCYAGNQTYGVQQLEFDEDSGDLLLECYGRPSGTEFPGGSRYVIDGSVPLYLDTVEVGQSVTGDASGFVTQAAAHATAAKYTDYEDGDGDGDKTEQETGWHMTLKCICANGKTMDENHPATVYGKTGHACQVCVKNAQFSTGLRSLGNNLFYGSASGSGSDSGGAYQWGKAYLYRMNRDTYTYEKITEPAKLLASYTMDAADTYEQDGVVYMKDTSGNKIDAVVQGTYAATGQGDAANGALGFRGDEYGDVLDRVYIDEEGMDYLNEKIGKVYSYSFWVYAEHEMDRFTPIIGMYKEQLKDDGTVLQTGLYDAVFELRYRNSYAVISHRGTSSPWYGELANGDSYIVKPGDSSNGSGDGSSYLFGNINGTNMYGQWMHYVVVHDGTTVTAYYNGEATSCAGSGVGSDVSDTLLSFEIGGFMNRNWIDTNVRCRFTGMIDDVQIYSGALTQSQAKALYEAGAAKSASTEAGAVAASGEKVFGTFEGTTLAEQDEPIVALGMDGVSNGIVADDSANGIDAIASEYVKVTADQNMLEGQALYFDGRSQVKPTKLSLNAEDTAWLSVQLNATKKMTISFWMNADFENSHRMSILGVYGKDGRPIGAFETHGTLGQDLWMDGRFAIAFTSAKPNSEAVKLENSLEQTAITATSPKYDNEFDNRSDSHYGDKVLDTWYHVVGELDQVNKKMNLYINGEQVSSVTIADGTLGEIGYFMVGAPAGRYYDAESSSDYGGGTPSARQGWAMRDGFVGTIDNIQIYNTTLGEEKVKDLYEGGLPNAGDVTTDAADAAEKAAAAAAEAQADAEAAKVAADAAKAEAIAAGTKAEEAKTAAEAAKIAAEKAQADAEAAEAAVGEDKAAAENAKDLAKAAQTKADAAQAAAEQAEQDALDAQTAAETAQVKAEDTTEAAEAAQTAAEAAAAAAAENNAAAAAAAQTAAETAAKAAEDASTAAVESAKAAVESGKAVASAKASAESAAESAGYAASAAESAKKAQLAQKAAEEAQAKAENAQAAADAAIKAAQEAALDGAKYQAAVNLDATAAQVDRSEYTTEQIEAQAKAVSDAKAAIAAAKTLEEVQKALDAGYAAIGAVDAVKPEVPEKAENPFVDIDEDMFCYDAVLWAVGRNITNGKDETHFDPTGDCTRAQVVTLLWRAAGEPEPKTKENPFPDVKEGAYYYKAVLWAVENGITNGFKDGTFGPAVTCTRGQIVTFLWRYADEVQPTEAKTFPDVAADKYYNDAVAWAVENGITSGYKDGTFGPDKTCTRDQIVTFLYRYLVEE